MKLSLIVALSAAHAGTCKGKGKGPKKAKEKAGNELDEGAGDVAMDVPVYDPNGTQSLTEIMTRRPLQRLLVQPIP